MAPKAKSKPKKINLPGAGPTKIKSQPRAPKKSNPAAFKPGNPHRFKSREELGGELDPKIDPGGRKANENTLLSKNLMTALNNRAPAAICERLELPATSSWSQCLAAFILRKAFDADDWAEAVRLIAQLTESNGKSAVLDELEQMKQNMLANGPAKVSVLFVESDGEGHVSEQSLTEIAAAEKHQQEFSDLALSNRTIDAAQLGFDN